jgi:hypothetical protein
MLLDRFRYGRTYQTDCGPVEHWHKAKRLKISRALPTARSRTRLGEVDMADANTLKEFVLWGRRTYPARRYALILWSHGQGYRVRLILANAAQTAAPNGAPPKFNADSSDPGGASVKSFGVDASSLNILFNATIASALAGIRFDLLGFDSCLMGMIESAYQFRALAEVFVASEDLVPVSGWNYTDWLSALAAEPTMTSEGLGKAIVASYRKQHENGSGRNIAAFRLAQVPALADAIDDASKSMMVQLKGDATLIQRARSDVNVFAPGACSSPGVLRDCYQHVDLVAFFYGVKRLNPDGPLAESSDAVIAAVERGTIDRFATTDRQTPDYMSAGLAIYFPLDASTYAADPFEKGAYVKGNPVHPISFVEEREWSSFLQAYFVRTP